MRDTSNWDRNPPDFTLDLVSYRLAILAACVSSGIITHYVLAFVCLHFAVSDTGVINLLEELCIMRVAVVNSFARVLNTREESVYIVIHRQIVSLYLNSSVWQDTQDA